MREASHAFHGNLPAIVDILAQRPADRVDLLTAEVPAATGIGEPRAVAAAYGAAVAGGLGLTNQSRQPLANPAQLPTGDPIDLVLRVPAHYFLGYYKPGPLWPFGSAANAAFGSPG